MPIKLKPILRGLVFIGTLVGLGLLVRHTDLAALFDTGWIDSEVRGKGLTGELIFVVVGTLFTAVGLPRQVPAFLGGYAFGFVQGTALGLLAAALGCIASFVYARLVGRSVVKGRMSGRIERIDAFLRENTFTMTLLIRLLPVGSNLATNLAAGVSSVSATAFIAGSAIGFVPQTLVFALVGSGVNVDPAIRVSLGVALFVASALLGVWLFHRFRRSRSMDGLVDGNDAD